MTETFFGLWKELRIWLSPIPGTDRLDVIVTGWPDNTKISTVQAWSATAEPLCYERYILEQIPGAM